MNTRILSTIVVAVACFSIAFAQGGQGGQRQGGGGQGGFGQRMGGGMGGPQMLSLPAVQTELKLIDSQKIQIQALLEANRSQMGGRGGAGGGQAFDPEAARAQREKLEAEIKRVLNEEQYTRYQQLVLQQQGPSALARPEIAEKVGLSEAQIQQIRQIQQAQQEAMRGMMQGGGGGGDRAAMQQQMQAMRAETDKKVLGVLNADQKATWEAMLGKPFTFPQQGRGGGIG